MRFEGQSSVSFRQQADILTGSSGAAEFKLQPCIRILDAHSDKEIKGLGLFRPNTAAANVYMIWNDLTSAGYLLDSTGRLVSPTADGLSAGHYRWFQGSHASHCWAFATCKTLSRCATATVLLQSLFAAIKEVHPQTSVGVCLFW